jgi:endonuclease/exonuclease/phosphatase family metal-dependent hydrolase
MPALSLLSLNTFGVPFFLSLGRIVRLALALERLAPGVLCLQEIQQNAYLPLLRRYLAHYPQLAYQKGGLAPNGGLVTALHASCPPVESAFHPFPNRGRMLGVGFADWALYKGVLATSMEIEGQAVVVLNTHLHANYAGDWQPKNRLAQIQRDQVQFLAELVRSQPAQALVVACGDFNFPRGTFLYDELMAAGGLVDPLAQDERPTYRPFPLVPRRWALSLDFVLYRSPAGRDLEVGGDILPIEDASRRLPTARFLTDHCALTLEVRWNASERQPEGAAA